jgi:hypothetical protein
LWYESDFVNNEQVVTDISIGAGANRRGHRGLERSVGTMARMSQEVFRSNILENLGREVALKDISKIQESVVRHWEAKPQHIVTFLEGHDHIMKGVEPESGVANAEIYFVVPLSVPGNFLLLLAFRQLRSLENLRQSRELETEY